MFPCVKACTKKIEIWAQNLKGLVNGFIENRQFAVNTNRNSKFLGRKNNIPD
jgi:hypothetical protein